MGKVIFILFILLSSVSVQSETPLWMSQQIEKDLNYFKDKTLSWSDLNAFFEKKAKDLSLVKYTIINNRVEVDSSFIACKNPKERINRYADILKHLCQTKGLPNTTLLISITDGLNAKADFPIFAMCKMNSDRIILIPDYESLGARYQVLKYDGLDIVENEFSWNEKKPQLIWRGSTAQYYTKMTEQNLAQFSRVTLCKLSEEFPSKINAKFTLFVQNADQIPYIYRFEGDHVSFKDQMLYKYHLLIDGNVSPYTKSGWKLFTNSLIFKPDSKWIQWYSDSFKANIHYIPVQADLSDLIEKVDWALENDAEAENVARNCRDFAKNHITLEQDLIYLYEAIMRYNHLNFVP